MMRSLESQYDSLRQEDIRSKASTDPMYKYYKRLLPKPRESEYYGKVQRPELEENYRNPKPKGSAYETSDRGLALIEGCLRGLPRERLTNISSDVGSLKTELRAAARRETDEVKSRLKPNSAHKVYAWRDLLEEREQKSAAYKSTKVPSEVFLPDKTDQLVTLFHKEHTADTARLRRMNGYWQIPKLGKTPTRDRYGLRILNNLELDTEIDLKGAGGAKTGKDYHYSWPYVDQNTGDSIKSWVKLD